jgi:hypothetical protein
VLANLSSLWLSPLQSLLICLKAVWLKAVHSGIISITSKTTTVYFSKPQRKVMVSPVRCFAAALFLCKVHISAGGKQCKFGIRKGRRYEVPVGGDGGWVPAPPSGMGKLRRNDGKMVCGAHVARLVVYTQRKRAVSIPAHSPLQSYPVIVQLRRLLRRP